MNRRSVILALAGITSPASASVIHNAKRDPSGEEVMRAVLDLLDKYRVVPPREGLTPVVTTQFMRLLRHSLESR